MFPDIIIIEEENARERKRREWRPEPLYAPRPQRRRPDKPSERTGKKTGSHVVVIDISDYSETEL